MVIFVAVPQLGWLHKNLWITLNNLLYSNGYRENFTEPVPKTIKGRENPRRRRLPAGHPAATPVYRRHPGRDERRPGSGERGARARLSGALFRTRPTNTAVFAQPLEKVKPAHHPVSFVA